MAKINQIGVPGLGDGILYPYRKNVESEWVYLNRRKFVKDGDHARAERLKQLLDEFDAKLWDENLVPLSPSGDEFPY